MLGDLKRKKKANLRHSLQRTYFKGSAKEERHSKITLTNSPSINDMKRKSDMWITGGTDSSVSCSKRHENTKLSQELGPLGNHSFGKGKKSLVMINFAGE